MNIKIPYRWLLEYLETEATPEEIAKYLSLCGPSVEKIETIEGEPVFDIEITSNRVDCMSILGVAREAAAILPTFNYRAQFKSPITKSIINPGLPVPLVIKNNPSLCKRIIAQVFEVNLGESSLLIKKRLIQAGLRPLNNVVDVTNFVMTEIGHPTHVFDYDKITTHQLIIRESKKGETAVSFDHKKYILTGGDIVIDDGTGQIVDLPGIIGTENSVVNPHTKRVIFFLETNNHHRIRQTSMTHGIRTVAATLNEKQVDPQLAFVAFQRGVELFVDSLKAKPISNLIDIYPEKIAPRKIPIDHHFLESRIGVKLSPMEVKRIFESLGFGPELKKDRYLVTVPSWRNNDVSLKEDLVEEVARIHGYHKIPSILPTANFLIKLSDATFYWEQKLKNAMKYSGFSECYTYSLVSRELIQKSGLDLNIFLRLKNPLTKDWVYLRISLLPSLLTIYQQNEPRSRSLSLFEMASTYLPQKNNLPKESMNLALVSNYNVMRVKEQLRLIFREINQPLEFVPIINPSTLSDFHVFCQKKEIGYVGKLGGNYFNNFITQRPVTIAELSVGPIFRQVKTNYHYHPIPKFNHIIEDLTFDLSIVIVINELIKYISQINNLIMKIELKERYQNRITLTFYYLDKQKQLSNLDILPLRKTIVSEIEKNFACKLVGKI